MENNQKKKTSKYYGVSWNTKVGKWVSMTKYRGEFHYLGAFVDEDEARRVYVNFMKSRDGYCPEDLPGEDWRPITECDGEYEVSNLGRVKKLNYKRTGLPLLQPLYLCDDGYYSVQMSTKISKPKRRVHRLVWEYFGNEYSHDQFIVHINGDKSDNRLSNLMIESVANTRVGAPYRLKDIKPVVNLKGEEWRNPFGIDGIWMVSNMGRIKTLSYAKTGVESLLQIAKDANGYCQCGVGGKTRKVHRMVWSAFNGDIGSDVQVNHKNFDKSDNRLSNLETMSCELNRKHYSESFHKNDKIIYERIDDRWVLFVRYRRGRFSIGSSESLKDLFDIHERFVLGENA